MADSLSSISIDNLTQAVNSLLNNAAISLPASIDQPVPLTSTTLVPPQTTQANQTVQEGVQTSSVTSTVVSQILPPPQSLPPPPLASTSSVRLPAYPLMLSVNRNVIPAAVAVSDLRLPAPNNASILPSNIIPLHNDKSSANSTDPAVLDLSALQNLLYNHIMNNNRLGVSVDSSSPETQSVVTHLDETQSASVQEVQLLHQSAGLNLGTTSDLLNKTTVSLTNTGSIAALLNTPPISQPTFTPPLVSESSEKDSDAIHANLSALLQSSQLSSCTYPPGSTNENEEDQNLTNQNVDLTPCNQATGTGVPVEFTVATESEDVANVEATMETVNEETYCSGQLDAKRKNWPQKKNSGKQKQANHWEIFHTDYQFCVQCNMMRKEACLVHNTHYTCVEDAPVLTRARVTVPGCLYLHQSSVTQIPNCVGVWSKQTIQEHSRFGPLVGMALPLELSVGGKVIDSFHPFRFVGTGNVLMKIKIEDEDNSNWMIFIRAARSLDEQNAVTYQQNNSVYVITTIEIKPDQELLTWYSADMCKALSLPQDPSVYKLVQCSVCGKHFSGKKLLYSHTKASHPDSYKMGWNCIVCVKTFSSRSSYKTHMMGHMGVKPHVCSFCGKEFTDRSNLRTHMAIHTGEKKFQCEKCNKCFRQKAHIESHMLTHTGEKKHKCLYCDKHFARDSERKIHMYQHTKELCYACHICGKMFYKTQNYKKHLKVHTGERNFMCSKCFRGFHTKYHRDRHLKICKEKNGKESSYMSLEEVAKLDNTCDAVPLTSKAQEVSEENENGSLDDSGGLHSNIFV